MPTEYVYFTDEQKEQARRTDLADLLRRQGERLKRSGTEYEWKDGSAKVTIRGNLWFHQYEEVGGDTIDFVRRFYDKSYPEAVEYLLDGCGGTLITSPPVVKEVKPFELPPANDTMHRVFAYLTRTRGIDASVMQTFADRRMIYESKNITTRYLSAMTQTELPVMRTSEAQDRQAPIKGMLTAACRNTASTGLEPTGICACLKLR